MMLQYGSPIGRSRTGHHTSGPALFMVWLLFSVVYKLWQWQTWWRAVMQNSAIRRVRGTRLTRAFKADLS
jgi:hypothetical protein